MNKIRLYQILSVLLLPYREETFLKKDPIAKVRYSFAELRYHKINRTHVQDYIKKYETAEKELSLFLRERRELYIHTLDDFRLLLEMFFPEEETTSPQCIFTAQKEEDKKWKKLKPDEEEEVLKKYLEPFYLKNLYKIAKSLLTFRDGKIAIRTWINENDSDELFHYPNVFDKVEIWNLLSRMMSVDVLIAAFFVEANLKEIHYLYNQTGGISLADKTLEKILKKGLAETHMHFTAGTDFMHIWQNEMDITEWEKRTLENEKCQTYIQDGTFVLAIYRILWAEYLEYAEGGGILPFNMFLSRNYPDEEEILLEILDCIRKGNLTCYSPEWGKKLTSLILRWRYQYSYNREGSDFLLLTIYRQYYKYHTCSEMILLFKSLVYFDDCKGTCDNLHLLFQYIRGKNHFYKQLLQANQIEGLANFRYSYSKMLTEVFKKNDKESQYDDIFKCISNNMYLKKLEIRIAPHILEVIPTQPMLENGKEKYEIDFQEEDIQRKLLKQIKNVLVAYRKNRLEAAGIYTWDVKDEALLQKMDTCCKNGELSVPTIGIVFHYIKNDYVDNRLGNTCWVQKWEEITKDSRHILVWREILVKSVIALEKLRTQIPLLGEYVVGIDAASEEHKTEPWVFAPIYSAIRNRWITKPVLQNHAGEISRINNIGFTYHVGEEYRHLLSGLRHIDEVVNHFHYKAGDRLGHATALGVNIEYWMQKNETVVIPAGEHMENLLWLWGNMVHRNWGIEINAEALEGKILNLAKNIYGETNGITVHMLYEAYEVKFTVGYWKKLQKMRQYLLTEEKTGQFRKNGEEHFCKYYDVKSRYGVMWTVEKIFCTYFCPWYYYKFHHPILVHVGQEELGMLKKIQNYVRQEVEGIGVYVETNPTSNLAIGEVKRLHEHPILNLNSKGLSADKENEHEVLVTVNSDNPMIFNTSSENELAYIYHALCYQGYKKESILEWIDKVRRMGLDSSFVKNEKKPSVQMQEIKELIDNINIILKEDNPK